jgi:hypothetical protein
MHVDAWLRTTEIFRDLLKCIFPYDENKYQQNGVKEQGGRIIIVW